MSDSPEKPVEAKPLPQSIASLSKTDEQYAAELKARVDAALTPLLSVMNEAAAAGFHINWGAIAQTPPDGRHRMIGLNVFKVKVF